MPSGDSGMVSDRARPTPRHGVASREHPCVGSDSRESAAFAEVHQAYRTTDAYPRQGTLPEFRFGNDRMNASDLKGFNERHVWIGADVQHSVLTIGRLESIGAIPSKIDRLAAARV